MGHGTEPYSGGCACGAVRYEVAGAPIAENYCQCRQCQRQTGTGHGSYLTFSGAGVTVQGEPSYWQTIGEGGTVKHGAFCPTCGSPLFLKFPDMPDIFVARAGSLDDPERFSPEIVLWTASGHAWDHLGTELTRFDKMPPAAKAA